MKESNKMESLQLFGDTDYLDKAIQETSSLVVNRKSVLEPLPTILIDELKNNWSEFLKFDKEKQRNTLGELLYPLVLERVGDELAPKITGMFVDLDQLELSDVFDILNDGEVLNERIEEAKSLLYQDAKGEN